MNSKTISLLILPFVFFLSCQSTSINSATPSAPNTLELTENNLNTIKDSMNAVLAMNSTLRNIFQYKYRPSYGRGYDCENKEQRKSDKSKLILIQLSDNKYDGTLDLISCLIYGEDDSKPLYNLTGFGELEIFEREELVKGMISPRDIVAFNSKKMTITGENTSITFFEFDIELVRAGEDLFNFRAKGSLADDPSQKFEVKTINPFRFNSLGKIVEQGSIIVYGNNNQWVKLDY